MKMKYYDIHGQSTASNALGLSLSIEKLKVLHPELFGIGSTCRRFRHGELNLSARKMIQLLREKMFVADSRASIVLTTQPRLLIANYSDEQDAVILLEFPTELVQRYQLVPDMKLLALNNYSLEDYPPADITHGPATDGQSPNYHTMIAEFMSDDMEVIENRKREITANEWDRTNRFARERLARTNLPPRDGRPLYSGRPAGASPVQPSNATGQTSEGAPSEDDWEKTWDSRMACLSSLLGKPSDNVFHSMIPFQMSGTADVVEFPNHVPGQTYITSELTGTDSGQIPNSLGQYELMICVRQKLDQAAELIAHMAGFSREARLEPGKTIQLDDFFGDKTLRALLVATPDLPKPGFHLNGKTCGLLLLIGITADELAFCKETGSDKLLQLLRDKGVFPYTIPDRPSVLTQG